MVSEGRIGRDVEGSGRGLILGTILAAAWVAKEKSLKLVTTACLQARKWGLTDKKHACCPPDSDIEF
jgi:hypothetical protein